MMGHRTWQLVACSWARQIRTTRDGFTRGCSTEGKGCQLTCAKATAAKGRARMNERMIRIMEDREAFSDAKELEVNEG